jgi:hypothetical protein
LGIALGSSKGQYGTLATDLSAQGFRRSQDESGGPRYVKTIGDVTVPVDFLAENSPSTQGTIVVDDIVANILPGIDRALATARKVEITGLDLYGITQTLNVRVCEVGPFLAMKLRAFANRQQPKDAFDIHYTLRYYDKGTEAAVEAFTEEVKVGNPACTDAIASLNEYFRDEQSSAPARAAHFLYGPVLPGESKDQRFRRQQIRQEVVDAAGLLKAAVPNHGI